MGFRVWARAGWLFVLFLTTLDGAWGQAGQRGGTPSPAELRKMVNQRHALPEDTLAAVKRLLALPPATVQAAAFRGNGTAIVATPGNAFLMVRETDCSLTAFNAGYTLDANDTTYTQASRRNEYDQVIHKASGLTTTASEAAGKCNDPGVGTASNGLIYVGMTASGLRVGALAGYNGQVGYNQLFTIVSKTDGTPVSTNTLPAPSVAGDAPYSLVAADLNKDGNKDLVSVNFGSAPGSSTVTSSVTVYMGHADGSFSAGTSYGLSGYAANGAMIDDFNGDGTLDIAIPVESSPGSGTFQMMVLPGKGDGTFGPATMTALGGTGAAPTNLVSGDFNGDNKQDIVCGSGLVLLGNGDGTFTAQQKLALDPLVTDSSSGLQLAVGDFNKDGALDVAAGTGYSIVVYLGNGDGTFAAGRSYASISNHGYLTATDLDGDGNVDLYSGDATSGIFGGDDFTPGQGYALMGNGDGTFHGAQNPVLEGALSNPQPVKFIQDLNGDGKVDYLALEESFATSAGVVRTYLGDGAGGFSAGPGLIFSPFTYEGRVYNLQLDSYTLVDVNGDGKADLVMLPTESVGARSSLLVALAKGDGSFAAAAVVPFPSLIPGGGMDAPYVTGLNSSRRADGKDELIYEFSSQSFAAPYDYYQGVATQGVNGDGTFAAPVLTVEGTYDSNAFIPAIILPSNVADLNGDKTPDLILYSPAVYVNDNGVTTLQTPATYQVQLGNADGTFGAVATVNVTDMPNQAPATIADVNGDGKLDLIALGTAAAGNGEIGVALGNGDGTFQAPKEIELEAGGNGFETLSAADFDGDGKVDVAILGYDPPNDTGLFLGNGDGTFQGAASGFGDGLVVPLAPIYLLSYGNGQAVDVNGDGKPDIFGSAILINEYGRTAVTPVATATTLMADPATITVGQTVTLTATVSGSGAVSGNAVPTGTVTFFDGTVVLGTGAVSGSGVATFAAAGLAVGTHAITASYGGDGGFAASMSGAVTVTVNAAVVVKGSSTTTVTASPGTSTVGTAVVLTAVVAAGSGSGSGSGLPTGTVAFFDGATMIGTGAVGAQGIATLSVATLGVGTHSITGSYGGDAKLDGSVSAAVSVVVIPAPMADFSLSLAPASVAAKAGGLAQTVVTVTPVNGFTGAVGLSCSGLPADAACNFTPASVTVGATVGLAVLTVTTTKSTAEVRGGGLTVVGLAGVLGFWVVRRRRWALRLCGLVVAAVLAATVMAGCGTGAAKVRTGSYTVGVTGASETLSHEVSFKVTVE